MFKEKLKELANDPNFIPGIYNYCDRWCERCPLTSRCSVFALEKEDLEDPEMRDIQNEKFWKKMGEMFQATRELVEEMAKRMGIDLDSLDLEAGIEEERLKDEIAQNHECSRAAKIYIQRVNTWFDSVTDLFKEKEDELSSQVQMDIPTVNPLGEAFSLKDAVEVIRWYQHQIYVKMMRAIRGKMDDEDESFDEYPKDSDGSAKVALIGMDRSISAWGELLKQFPQQEDPILDILLHLDRQRRKAEKEFPEARAFVRPGFDDSKGG